MDAEIMITLPYDIITMRMSLDYHGPGDVSEYWSAYFSEMFPNATSVSVIFDEDAA